MEKAPTLLTAIYIIYRDFQTGTKRAIERMLKNFIGLLFWTLSAF
jgi:hypothetical protein